MIIFMKNIKTTHKMSVITKTLSSAKFWKELFIMTLGMLVAAAAVYYFLMPSKLIVGSISGLSIVITEIFKAAGIDIGLSSIVFAINALLLVIAWFLIGHEFGAKTIYTALILGPLISFWETVMPYERLLDSGASSIMNDPWFDLLCFVLVLSASQAILFRINASTGGLDIIAKIVNKYLHFDMGTSVTVAGAVICCTAFAINPFRMVVIGLIGTWINGIAVDYFTASLNRRKRVCIISDEHEQVRRYIVDKLERGCSLYPVRGGYSDDEKVEVEALLTQNEFSDLLEYIKNSGIKGFVTAGNVSEIYGSWHEKSRRRKKRS